jgi:fatty acid synthase subunit beta, fungi type
MIALESKALLEIVNYNVDGEQYVCAGTVSVAKSYLAWRRTNDEQLENLHVLGLALDYLSRATDSRQIVDEAINEQEPFSTELRRVIADFLIRAQKVPKPIQLQRGAATIPLKGIDVPFHSTHLRPGVQSYRKFLQRRIVESNIHPERLIGRFVPNVMAQPFSLEPSYIEEAYRLTESPELKELLASTVVGQTCPCCQLFGNGSGVVATG